MRRAMDRKRAEQRRCAPVVVIPDVVLPSAPALPFQQRLVDPDATRETCGRWGVVRYQRPIGPKHPDALARLPAGVSRAPLPYQRLDLSAIPTRDAMVPLVIAEICRAWDVDRDAVISPNGRAEVVLARVAVCRALSTGLGLPEAAIARRLGGRDHSTIGHSLARAKALIAAGLMIDPSPVVIGKTRPREALYPARDKLQAIRAILSSRRAFEARRAAAGNPVNPAWLRKSRLFEAIERDYEARVSIEGGVA